MALLEDDRLGPERGGRARRALVAGAVGAAFGLMLTGFLSNISAGTGGVITLLGAAIGAWFGAWTPRGFAVASEGKTHSTAWVGAHAPDEASVRDMSSPRGRRPAHP